MLASLYEIRSGSLSAATQAFLASAVLAVWLRQIVRRPVQHWKELTAALAGFAAAMLIEFLATSIESSEYRARDFEPLAGGARFGCFLIGTVFLTLFLVRELREKDPAAEPAGAVGTKS